MYLVIKGEVRSSAGKKIQLEIMLNEKNPDSEIQILHIFSHVSKVYKRMKRGRREDN